MNFSQILPRLFVGSCPTHADDINHLKTDYGVNAILNFQTDHDLDYWDLDWNRLEARCQELTVEVHRVAIRDFDGVDLRTKLPQGVQALDELLKTDHTVYAYCNVGMGRSPSVVIAYLVWRQGWNLDDAIEHVTRSRSCSPNIEAIVQAARIAPRRKAGCKAGYKAATGGRASLCQTLFLRPKQDGCNRTVFARAERWQLHGSLIIPKKTRRGPVLARSAARQRQNASQQQCRPEKPFHHVGSFRKKWAFGRG